MEINEMIKKLSGRNTFNDITLYECEVIKVYPETRNVLCRSIGGIEVPDITASLMTTIGDGSYLIPRIGSTVYILINPLINPFIVHYGEIESAILETTVAIQLNGNEYGGIVKVDALTEKLNNLENVVNNLLSIFNTHTHISAVEGSPTTGPVQIDNDVLQNTMADELANPAVTHGTTATE